MKGNFRPPPPLQNWWTIWAALLAGPFVLYSVLGGDERSLTSLPFPWQIMLIAFAIAGVIRWFVIPRVNNGGLAFICFMIGLSLSEAPAIAGLFVFQHVMKELFILSLISMTQFAPFFAKRFYPDK